MYIDLCLVLIICGIMIIIYTCKYLVYTLISFHIYNSVHNSLKYIIVNSQIIHTYVYKYMYYSVHVLTNMCLFLL